MKTFLELNDMPALVRFTADYMEPHRAELADLDSQTGDGDMGVTIALILKASGTCAESAAECASFKEFSKKMYEAIGETAPSTFGTFVATMFRTISRNCGEITRICTKDYADFLQWAAEGVMKKGKAAKGDKTLLDALIPAAEAAAEAVQQASGECDLAAVTGRARAAAEEGAATAAGLVARIGRAGYMGERTIGMKDPGAEAIALFLAAIDEYVRI